MRVSIHSRLFAATLSSALVFPACFEEKDEPAPFSSAAAPAAAPAGASAPSGTTSSSLPGASFSMRISCDVTTTPQGRKVGLETDAIKEVCGDPNLNMDKVGNTSETPLSDPNRPKAGEVYAAGVCPTTFIPELKKQFGSQFPSVPDGGTGHYQAGGGNTTGEITGLCLEISANNKTSTVQIVDALMPSQCSTPSGKMHIDLHACSLQQLGYGAQAPDDGDYVSNGATWKPVPCPYADDDARIVLKTGSSNAYGFMPLYTRLPVVSAKVKGVPDDKQPTLSAHGLFEFSNGGGLEPGKSYEIELTLADGSKVTKTLELPQQLPKASSPAKPDSPCQEAGYCQDPSNHHPGTYYSPQCIVTPGVACNGKPKNVWMCTPSGDNAIYCGDNDVTAGGWPCSNGCKLGTQTVPYEPGEDDHPEDPKVAEALTKKLCN